MLPTEIVAYWRQQIFITKYCSMQIDYLADHLHLAPTLAQWHYDEWRDLLPRWSYEEALADLQSHTGHACIPTTFVALEGSQLLGSASLILDDFEAAGHLSPWLASVFVTPEQRGKGIGSKLVTRAMLEARQLQIPKLYLFTAGQAAYYRQFGWSFYRQADCYGREVTIMDCVLANILEKTKSQQDIL